MWETLTAAISLRDRESSREDSSARQTTPLYLSVSLSHLVLVWGSRKITIPGHKRSMYTSFHITNSSEQISKINESMTPLEQNDNRPCEM